MIFKYFAKTYGTIGGDSANTTAKYNDKSCKQLMKLLMDLKTSNGSVKEIKWVSGTLRSQLKCTKTSSKLEVENNFRAEIQNTFFESVQASLRSKCNDFTNIHIIIMSEILSKHTITKCKPFMFQSSQLDSVAIGPSCIV